jgi:hypothetical protein
MSQTFLLPPATAVRIIWARTGEFSNDDHSKISAQLSVDALKNIRDRAEADDQERKYVESAIVTMDATYRNLDIIYKGRDLNFKENETLRQAYLDSIKDNMEFGKKAGDYLKTLPSLSVFGAGSITLVEFFNLQDFKWAFVMGTAALGYGVTRLIVEYTRKQTQRQYIAQDYERNLYYDQYISRTVTTLVSLYSDLDRIHRNVFGQTYPVDTNVSDIICEMLKGIRPTFCPYIHKHMKQGVIKPEYWTLCETGNPAATQKCPLWEGRID